MTEELKTMLYGKTATVALADGKNYIMREPSIEDLENIRLDDASLSDIKNIKKLAWVMLSHDNPDLDEKKFGRLVTMSMMVDGSPFMESFTTLIGGGKKERKN